MNATDILNRGINAVEEKSKIFLKDNGVGYGKLIDAMNYSVSAGGKRLRPALLRRYNTSPEASGENGGAF